MMVLVDYPDSDDEVNGPGSQSKPQAQRRSPHVENELFVSPRKRKHQAFAEMSQIPKPLPPPLPSAFHSLYATNVRASTSDDPSLHGGRKRQVPHVEGNWPTHVHVEWYPSRTELETLESILNTLQVKTTAGASGCQSFKIHSLLRSDLGVQLPLHISLSAPLMLRTEQRTGFLEKLQDAVKDSGLRSFSMLVTALDWMSNSEKSRWFLALRLRRPENDGLNRLLAVTNSVASDSGLETLYADEGSNQDQSTGSETRVRRTSGGRKEFRNGKERALAGAVPADCTSKFHFSLAWQLEEPDRKSFESSDIIESVDPLGITCESLKVKIGNVVHDLPLPQRRSSQQGLGGM